MSESDGFESIAIIGMAGRFPEAKNIEEYWEKLMAGTELISFFSKEDAYKSGASFQDIEDTNFVNAGGILANFDLFDADFFGINEMEAKAMDPQHRIFLECAWEALEQAGYSTTNNLRTGVFAAASSSGYLTTNILPEKKLVETLGVSLVEMNNTIDFLPSKVSYKLNLKGPSVAIQCGCASSLAALHFAVQNLLNYQCDMAIVGGVSVRLYVNHGYVYEDGGILSPDGHCRPFDENAQGTVGGNGAGVLILRRYLEAVDECDHIYALIKGTAMNNDGSNKVGYTAPGFQGQVDVIREAYEFTQINPATVSFVETQGVGTPLGDSIEVAALTQVFQEYTQNTNFCALGSVKANIGHLDVAGGIASLIKTALVLKNRAIPPLINLTVPAKNLNLTTGPFYLNQTVKHLPAKKPLRASVNCFGIGGSNIHVVLESCEHVSKQHNRRDENDLMIIPLSAKSQTSLNQLITTYINYLKKNQQLDLADIAYTLQKKRPHFLYRKAFIISGTQELINELNEAKNSMKNTIPVLKLQPIFVFPRCEVDFSLEIAKLLHKSEVFAKYYTLCTTLIERLVTKTDLILENRLRWFSFLYSLANMLKDLGINPKSVCGYGLGENISLALIGTLTLEEAMCACLANTEIESDANSLHTINLEQLSRKDSMMIIFGPAENCGEFKSIGIYHFFEITDVYRTIVQICADMWISGESLIWENLSSFVSCSTIPLPTYSFERKKYWIEPLIKEDQFARPAQPKSPVKISKNQIQDELISIIKTLIGDIEINLQKTFNELGGSSFLAIQLILKINEAFETEVTMQDLFQNPTIEQLYHIITKRITQKPVSNFITTYFNPGKKNLILLPPLNGIFPEYGKEKYGKMSTLLNQDTGLIIIQPTLDFKTVATQKTNSISYMAEECVKYIIQNCLQERYTIGGWCDGGILAVEICKKLALSGHYIETVFLFDTYEITYLASLQDDVEVQSFKIDQAINLQAFLIGLFPMEEEIKQATIFDELMQIDKDGWIDHLMKKIKSPSNLNTKMVKKMYARYMEMWEHSNQENYQLFAGYNIADIHFNLIVFSANMANNPARLDESLGWKHVNSGKTECFLIDGNHLTMLLEPGINQITKIINQYL